MRNRIISFALGLSLISMLLAGCLAGDDPAQQDAGGDDDSSAQVTEDAGAVQGAVSSDVFEPLADARVELLTMAREATEFSSTTGADGEFSISRVEPGEYIVFVTRVGYEANQRGVEVVAGEVTEVRVQLELLPETGPYAEEFDRVGFVTWAAAWQAEPPGVGCITIESPVGVLDPKSCGGVRGGGGDAGETRVGPSQSVEGWTNIGASDDFRETDLDDLKTIMVEMRWNPAGPLGEHFLLDMMCSDMPRGSGGAILDLEHDCYQEARGASPLQIRFDEEHWLEHDYNYTGTWAARVFATYGMLGTHGLTGVDVGAAYEQSFEKYWTIFHGEPAPEGFSRLPDA